MKNHFFYPWLRWMLLAFAFAPGALHAQGGGTTNCLQIDCPANKEVQCGTPWSFDQPTATSCCPQGFASSGIGTNVLITPIGFSTNGACPTLEITEYWSIVDACGNKAVCSQTVTVVGCCTNQPCLTVDCPANKTVQCGTAWTFDQPIVHSCCTNQINSPAGPPTNVMVMSAGFVTNGECPLLEITENWVIQDGCGDTATCSQTVTVVGCCNSKPCLQVICPPAKAVQCGTPWTFDPPTVYSCCTNEFFSATGAVAPTNVLIMSAGFVTNGTCPHVEITETWAIADACGDTSNCSQTVTVLGCCSSPPCLTVDCPANKTVQCGTPWTFDQPVVYSCCTNPFVTAAGLVTNVMVTPASIVTNGSCPEQEITITWNIFDACGDATNCMQTVTVLGCCNTNPCLQVDCPGNKYVQCGTPWTFDQPLVYTCCTNRIAGTTTNVIVTPHGLVTNGACPALEITENWTITDGCGDTATCSQTVTVVGCCTNQPCLTVNCPANKTVQCGTTWSFDEPTATSCCTNVLSTTSPPTNIVVVLSGIVTNGVCPNVQVTATWDIFDACGDAANCSQTVTIIGCCNTNCLIVDCPPDKDVQCATAWSFDQPTATSCCTQGFSSAGAATNVLITPIGFSTNGACPSLQITEYWSIADACGNKAVCSQTVTVFGCCTNPCLEVVCPPDKRVQCGTTWTFDEPIIHSCCTNQVGSPAGPPTNVTVVVAGFITNGECPLLEITENWLIQDGCGDMATCAQTVTVVGCCTNKPCLQVICSADKAVQCGTPWTFDPPTVYSCCTNEFFSATGAVAPTNILITSAGFVTNGTCPRVDITETWSIADACGDTSNCSQTVTVLGCCTNIPPCLVVDCPTNKTVECGTGWTFDRPVVYTCCTNQFVSTAGLVTNVMITPASIVTNGSCPEQEVTITWNIFDACGDATNCMQTVTVLGCCNTNPCLQVDCPSNKYVQCGTPWTFDQPIVYTCCTNKIAGTTTNLTVTSHGFVTNGACPALEITENWVINDGCGDAATCSQTVTVVGCCTNQPCLTVDCPTNKTVQCGTAWTFDEPTATSCCTNGNPTTGVPANIVVVLSGIVTNGVCPKVEVTATWDIFDACGDAANCTQTVTIIGCCNTNCLIVDCPPDKDVQCGTPWSFDQPTATSCCTNPFAAGGVATNVLITPLGFSTNGACPQLEITEYWSIADACGNKAVCSQTVTIFGCCTSCLEVECPADKRVQCGTDWTFDQPIVHSCCTNQINSSSGPPTNVLVTSAGFVTNGACPLLEITENWVIQDGCGNTNYCSQTVTVVGCCTNKPCLQVICPPDKTVQCGTLWTFDPPMVYSCCTNEFFSATGAVAPTNVLITSAGFVTNGTCPRVEITETWSIADACGDTSNCSQTVTVLGCCTSPPCLTVDCPTNKTVECGTDWTFDEPKVFSCCTNQFISAAGVDYNVKITTASIVTNGVCPRQEITITWNIFDACGDATNCMQTVTVLGCCNTNPCLQVDCASNKYVQCGTPWTFDPPTVYSCCTNRIAGAATNVIVTSSGFITNGACPSLEITENWTIADACGDTATCSQTVTVVGCCTNQPCLTVDCPTNRTVQCGTAWSFDEPTATSCCTNLLSTTSPPTRIAVVLSGIVTNGVCPNVQVTATWDIFDACGDSATCSQTVTILGCCANTNCLVVDCPPNKDVQCGTPWSFDEPTATSCCTNPFAAGGIATNVLITPLGFSTNGACPQLEITKYWSIADTCGDKAVCSQTVTIFGCCTNCLEVECPADKRVQCGTAWTFDQPIVSSCCTNQFYSPNGLPTNVLVTPAGFVTNGACPLLEITENWIIQDGCGNTTNCSQTVTVVGCCTNKPCLQVICSPDKAVQCGTPWTFDPPTVYSCCTNEFFSSTGAIVPTNVLITSAGFVTNGTCPRVEITETWSIADACGDTSNCSQTVTVLGCCTNIPPCLVVDCPTNKTVECGSGWTFDTPVVYTCCTNLFVSTTGLPTTNIMVTPASIVTNGSCPEQEITITWNIFDACGDSTNCIQTVTVLGCCTNKPCLEVDCSSNKYVQCGTVWSFDPPLAYSCCVDKLPGTTNNVAITSTGFVTNGACPALEITENWTIHDACGDNATCSQTVTVVGCCTNQPCLTVNCPTNKNVQCGTTWSFDEPTATSCCTNGNPATGLPANIVVVLSGIVTNGVCPKVEVTATWDIFDACGDSATCSQIVTILGCCTPPPCLITDCATNKTVECGSVWSFDPPTVTTCCASNIAGTKTNLLATITTVTNGVCPKVITRTWFYFDGCGDSNYCSQTVTVIDTTPPVVTCPTNIIIVNLDSNCLLVIPPISITATDNCTPACSLVYSQTPPAGTIVPRPSANVTVCVSDLCGNTTCCKVLVEGQDKTPPIVIVPQYVIATNCVVPCVPVDARSLCCPAIPTVTQEPPCNSPLGPGINTITITVTDCHGNSVTRLVHLVVGGGGSFLSALTNTGIGITGALLPDDSVDPHYSLPSTAVPGGVPGDYQDDAVAVSDICHLTGDACAYLNNLAAAPCYEYVPWSLPPDAAYNPSAVSKWIGPNYTNNGCDPAGNYTYTLNFNFPAGLSTSTATIAGRWAADNAATLKLNGTTIPALTPSFAYWRPFAIPVGSPFVTGANSLQFIVTNYSGFTGLRVEFTNAFATCFECVPPVISSITPSQSLPAGSTATLNVVAGGTPPLSYQWQFNYGNIAGATASTLTIPSIAYTNAGLYTVIVSDPCGSVTNHVRVGVTLPLPWTWANWNVATITNPLAASFGGPLGLTGSNAAPNYSITAGTADDFGIDNPNGGSPNVIEINPRSGVGLVLPMVTPSGTTADASYTLVLDLYEPDTSWGTPSTIFISSSNVNVLTSGDQDGLSVSLDISNYVHVTSISDGNLYDLVSTTPFPVDTWNRLGIVVQGPQPDGTGASISAYLDGVITTTTVICPCCILHITPIDWSISAPVLFPGEPGADQNAEFFVSDIQFHSIAMSGQMIAGLGSPDAGPAPVNPTTVSQQPPPLTATISAGTLNIIWPGSPYELQETTDLSSGIWTTSTLSFTETQGGGNVTTTASGTSASQGPAKFYRLVFRP